jgi:acetyltransferase-like isoleucine patch superfamily enzyme
MGEAMEGSVSATFDSILSELRSLEDGVALGGVLTEALNAELARRATAAADGAAWPPPLLSQLSIRRHGPLREWSERRNICIAGEGAGEPQIGTGFFGAPSTDGMLILGCGVKLNRVAMMGSGGLIVVGDKSRLDGVTLSVKDESVIMVGEQTVATFVAQLDSRNGGAILMGADGLWANDLRIITDDMHAIRDLASGARINRYGGRVLIGRHVWFGERAAVIGDCNIGADTVIGMGSLVTNTDLPPNSVCVGWPARPVRTGTTWTREDAP